MDTNDDIELHDLQTIETRLCTEPRTEAQTREGEAADASEARFGAASGFLVT